MPSYQSMKDVGIRFTYVDKPLNRSAKFKKSVEALDLPHFSKPSEARSADQTKSRLNKFKNFINDAAAVLRPKIEDRLTLTEDSEHFFIKIKSQYDTSIPELVKYVLTNGGKQPFAKKSKKREPGSSKKGSCGDLGKRKCEKLKERKNTFKRHKSLCAEYDKAGDKFYETGITRNGFSGPIKNKYKLKKEPGSSRKASKYSKKSKEIPCKPRLKSKSNQLIPP